jgi:hypothetical protein
MGEEVELVFVPAVGKFAVLVVDFDEFIEILESLVVLAFAADDEFDSFDDIGDILHLLLDDVGLDVLIVDIFVDPALEGVDVDQSFDVLLVEFEFIGEEVLF